MANRFTDTDKWKKAFLRGLQTPYKLLWLYICDDCNHAGIWEVDMDVACMRIGEQVNQEEALEQLGGKAIPFDGGQKWFIPSFIEFQYPGGLNPKNLAHGGAIKILRKYGLINEELEVLNKPLINPSKGPKDKVMDKEEDMDEEEEVVQDGGSGEGNERLLIPQMAEIFRQAIPTYPSEKYRDGRALLSIAKFLCEQGNIRGAPEENSQPVLEAWEQVSLVIAGDNFYCQKSLSTISNHIQEIVQKALHGDKSKPVEKNGKRDLAAESKAALLKRAAGGKTG